MTTDRRTELGVTVVAKSNNAKLGDAASTWSNKHTCPGRCPFLGICYPHHKNSRFASSRLDATEQHPPVVYARREAELIDKLNGKRPLRLKVYGDAPDRESARTLAAASDRYAERTGQPVWTYTHAWDVVKPEDWGGVSALASCETASEVALATALGWPTAIVVEEFATDKRHVNAEGLDIIPCPAQTKHVKCSECRLCMRGGWLKRTGASIAFKIHDDGENEILAAVRVKNTMEIGG